MLRCVEPSRLVPSCRTKGKICSTCASYLRKLGSQRAYTTFLVP